MTPVGSLLTLLLAIFGLLVHVTEAEAGGRTRKPAIILVPAAFSKATVYDQVKAMLCDIGYLVVAVDLPSIGQSTEHVDRTSDVQVVQKALGQQIYQGQRVILVGNSYGCTVICDALKDFEYESTVSDAADGKIMGVVFVSSCDISCNILVSLWLR